jgi:hypothetical protein
LLILDRPREAQETGEGGRGGGAEAAA